MRTGMRKTSTHSDYFIRHAGNAQMLKMLGILQMLGIAANVEYAGNDRNHWEYWEG